jgi:hypothetical protein
MTGWGAEIGASGSSCVVSADGSTVMGSGPDANGNAQGRRSGPASPMSGTCFRCRTASRLAAAPGCRSTTWAATPSTPPG